MSWLPVKPRWQALLWLHIQHPSAPTQPAAGTPALWHSDQPLLPCPMLLQTKECAVSHPKNGLQHLYIDTLFLYRLFITVTCYVITHLYIN